MIFNNNLWILSASLFSLPFFVKGDTTVITTTLNSAQERSAAILDQQYFISRVMVDADTNYASYTSVMAEEGIEFPAEMLQFIIEMQTYEITDFATSVYISDFPFNAFSSFITNFPWISSYMSEYSMTTFKVPADYSVITTTIVNNEATQATASAGQSASSSLVSSTVSSVGSNINSIHSSNSKYIVSSTSPANSSSSSSSNSSSSSSSSASASSSVSSIQSSSQNAAMILVPNTILFLLLSLFI